MGDGGRKYKGVSEPDRQADRRARLVDAGLAIVGESGAVAVTAEAVARRAGVSKRYFYESFSDRDAVLVAAIDQVYADLEAKIVEHVTAAGDVVRDRVAGSVDASLDTLRLDERIARLYEEARSLPGLRERHAELVEGYIDFVSEVVFRAPRSSRNRLAATAFVAASTDMVNRWTAGGVPLTREALVDYIATMGAALHAQLVETA